MGKNLGIEFIVVKPTIAESTGEKSSFSSFRAQEENSTAKDVPEAKKEKGKHPQLRSDYTFENFVIGDNNGFASNAALAISKNPGTSYNPFLIYGGVGLGKTHLCSRSAIGSGPRSQN